MALVLVPCTAAELVDVRSARHADFTRIVFETDEKVSYAIENRSLGSERAIELTLPAVAREMVLRAVHEPAVSVQVQTYESGSRALVRVNGPVDVWTNQLGNPPRVVLDLRVAEPVADRDPEQLDALDYQILVEADPGVPLDGTPEPTTREPSAAAPPPSDPPAVSSPPDAARDPQREPLRPAGDPPTPAPVGWASSTRLWWGLLVVALVFIAVLWGQRITQRRRREERAGPAPATPRPRAARPLPPQVTRVPPAPTAKEPPAPPAPPSPEDAKVEGPAGAPPAGESSETPPVPVPAAPSPETPPVPVPTAPGPETPEQPVAKDARDAAAPQAPPPESTPDERPEPPPVPPTTAPPRPGPARASETAPSPRSRGGTSESLSELFELLGRMEERLAVMERELRETRAEERALRERSIAQSEELRAQRVAVARLLRRPRSAPSTHTSSRSPSSS